MYFLVTDFWHEVRRVNTWVVWLAFQGGGGGSYENEDPEDEDLRPPYENEDPLWKRRPPPKRRPITKTSSKEVGITFVDKMIPTSLYLF